MSLEPDQEDPPRPPDRRVRRRAVLALCAAVLMIGAIVGAIVVTRNTSEVADLVTIVSGALALLVPLITTGRRRR